MLRTTFSALGCEVREVLLLERAGRESAAMTPTQRAVVRTYAEAATRRLQIARELRGPKTGVALELYRRAGCYLVFALLAARGDGSTEDTNDPIGALHKLASLMDLEGAALPPNLERLHAAFAANDPLMFDGLPENVAEQQADELELVTRSLARSLELRSPRELTRARWLRLSVTVAAVVMALVLSTLWIKAPKNLAAGKQTQASSVMFSTDPSGVVDGRTFGPYGFHSALEESPWLSIDLGRPYLVRTIKVLGRGDGVSDQSIPLACEVSDDGITYRPIAQRNEAFSSVQPWVVRPDRTVTRFIRLHTLRSSYLVLTEVEVYGHDPEKQ